MKKVYLLLMLVLTIVGCDNNIYHWNFNYDYEEIVEIKIIEMIDESEYREIKYVDLSLAKEIYEAISKLEMRRYGTNLSSQNGICFLIVFSSGNYDIISQQEPKHYIYTEGKIAAYNSWLYCDKSEYDALINKYLN